MSKMCSANSLILFWRHFVVLLFSVSFFFTICKGQFPIPITFVVFLNPLPPKPINAYGLVVTIWNAKASESKIAQKKETKWERKNSERPITKKNKLNFMHIVYTFVPYVPETNLFGKKKYSKTKAYLTSRQSKNWYNA